VFPSVSESFGLPLIEARQVGLPIVASELDFVRDVCEPEHSFDPYSSVSIARAIRRFLGQNETPVEPVGAEAFLSAVMREIVQRPRTFSSVFDRKGN
jgi:glycosyltransferase involved in cell wall biosynthesis